MPRMKFIFGTAIILHVPMGHLWASDDQGRLVIWMHNDCVLICLPLSALVVGCAIIHAACDFIPWTTEYTLAVITAILSACCGIRCVFTDPGYIPKISNENVDTNPLLRWRPGTDDSACWCEDCGHYCPRDSVHCKKCGMCVLDYDHHCGVMGACIGHRNMKWFLLAECCGTITAALSTFGVVAPSLLAQISMHGFLYWRSLLHGVLLFMGFILTAAMGGMFLWHALLQFTKESNRSPHASGWHRTSTVGAAVYAHKYWFAKSFPSLMGYYYYHFYPLGPQLPLK